MINLNSNNQDIKENIKQIVCKYLDINNDIADDENLIQIGMNSIAFIQIVVKIERIYGISFDDMDLNFQNFATVEAIYSYTVDLLNECS